MEKEKRGRASIKVTTTGREGRTKRDEQFSKIFYIRKITKGVRDRQIGRKIEING